MLCKFICEHTFLSISLFDKTIKRNYMHWIEFSSVYSYLATEPHPIEKKIYSIVFQTIPVNNKTIINKCQLFC